MRLFKKLLLLALAVSACGKVEKSVNTMDEMNNTTKDMSDTTSEMNKKMADMNDKTASMDDRMIETNKNMEEMKGQMGKMSEDMTHLGADARQAIALLTRLTAYDALNKAPEIEGKFAAMGQFYSAFEFQVWKGVDLDTEERREELFQSAMSEFFRTFAGSMATQKQNLSPSSKENEMNNLYAAAALLHYENPNQKLFLKDTQYEVVTFYSLFKELIVLQKQVKSGAKKLDELKAWEKEGLVWYDQAVYLMRLRANFLAAMVVSRLADLDAQRGGMSMDDLWTKAKIMLTDWEPKLDKYADNPVALDEVRRYANASNSTRAFLNANGVSNEMDANLSKVIGHMTISEESVRLLQQKTKTQPGVAAEFLKEMNELKKAAN